MRPGPPRGATATLEVTVTAGMVPDEGAPSTYPTAALAGDVEQVCRSLVSPHLEAGEVSVGVRLELLQRAPVPVGSAVVLTATVASVHPHGVTCEVQARHDGIMVARGSFEQEVVSLAAFEDEVAARRSS